MIYLSTTGTKDTVIIEDLGSRKFVHPTIDFNLLEEYTAQEISQSDDLQNAIDNGWITLKNEYGEPIKIIFDYSNIMLRSNYDTDKDGVVDLAANLDLRSDEWIYLDTNKQIGIRYSTASDEVQINKDTYIENSILLAGKSVTYGNNEGKISYDNVDHVLKIENDQYLQQLGQEFVYRVYNNTQSTIVAGTVVRFNGAENDLPLILPAQADEPAHACHIMGFVVRNIAPNSEGYVMRLGILKGIDTSHCTAGNPIYLSQDEPGGYTDILPKSGVCITLGGCLKSDPSNGELIVTILPPEIIGQIDINPANFFGSGSGETFAYVYDETKGRICHEHYATTAGTHIGASITQITLPDNFRKFFDNCIEIETYRIGALYSFTTTLKKEGVVDPGMNAVSVYPSDEYIYQKFHFTPSNEYNPGDVLIVSLDSNIDKDMSARVSYIKVLFYTT